MRTILSWMRVCSIFLLIIQAEHGGGNNSTFTVRVTSSTRTDTYSSIAAGIGSLKVLAWWCQYQGYQYVPPLKRGNQGLDNLNELDIYLKRMLNKEAYDKTGLIYGIGHAVYTLSDPRAVELKRLAGELAKEKGREDEYNFLKLIEQEGIKCLQEHRGGSKPACANLDFYSGFIYEMIVCHKRFILQSSQWLVLWAGQHIVSRNST